ncbi:MAG TPA: nuclear transport factor 2 family protein [Thermoleophilaceae bacterium]|nr:nuclear transport factor 2 family protein [Thermoleophilaceae bacterium]
MSETSQATAQSAVAPGAQTAEEIGRAYFQAVTDRDPERMATFWAPDGIEDIVPLGIFRGPDEVKRLFTEMFAAIPDSRMTVTRITASDRVAVVEWRFEGEFTGGSFQGIEPTGGYVQLRGADCIEVEDGRIVRNTANYDGMAFARSIGMMPPMDSPAERAMKKAFNLVTRVRRAFGR